jgi:hypothetical protein
MALPALAASNAANTAINVAVAAFVHPVGVDRMHDKAW